MPVELNGVDVQHPLYLLTSRFMRDPYPTLASLMRSAPAVPVEANGYRMWVITRYDDVRKVLAGREFLKDMLSRRKELSRQAVLRSGRSARLLHPSRRSLLERDGTDHRRMRLALAPAFTPDAVARRRARIEETAARLVHCLPIGEPVDLIARFARPLAAEVIGDIVGLSGEQLDNFPQWENEMLSGKSIEEIEAAGVNLFRFAQEMVERKRREPSEDLYSTLVRLCDEKDVFDAEELASTFMVLLVGGSEPVNAIANSLLNLLRNPDQLALVRAQPSLLSNAVEEGLRLESPFRMLPPRFSDKPFELDGVVIPPREVIVPSLATANRDPRHFVHPDLFDITTTAARTHLSFGHGPHRCLGMELGRLETRIALETLLDRHPNIRLAVPPSRIQWRPGLFMRRMDALPVILS